MRFSLAALLAAAAGVRTAALVRTADAGLYFDKFPLLADRLRTNGWLPDTPFAYSPLYTYLVALIRATLGTDPIALGMIQIALDCLVVALVWVLARRTWNRPTAVVAAGMAALAGPLVLHSVSFESDSLGLALSLAAVAAAAAGCRRRTPGWFALAGLLLGLRVCQRPNGVVTVIGFVTVLLVMRWHRRRQRLLAVAWLVAATALPVTAVVVVSSGAAGELTPVMSSSGWVLYTSHNHAATGLGYAPPPLALELKREPSSDPVARMDDAVSRRIASWVAGRRLGATAASAFWRDEALRCVRQRGWRAQLDRERDRLWFAVHRYEALDNPAAVACWQRIRRWPLLGCGLVLPLGLAGLVRRAYRDRARLDPAEPLLVVLAVASVLSMAVFYVASRFRLELVAALLPFAAWGLVDIITTCRHRLRIADGLWLATLVIGLTISNLPSAVVTTHARRALIRLETVRGDRAPDVTAAVASYRRATSAARYPAEAGVAWQRLAALLPRLGDATAARDAARHAAGLLSPATSRRFEAARDDPDAQWALGRHLLLLHRPSAAAEAFGAALAAQPFDPQLQFALAVALDAVPGASPDRIRELVSGALANGLRFSGDAPRAWRLLARQAAALGDDTAAATASDQATRLEAGYLTLLGAAVDPDAAGASNSSP